MKSVNSVTVTDLDNIVHILKVMAMGKKTLTIILGILAMAGGVFAQGTSIALVDSERVLDEFEEAKNARAFLDQSIIQWRYELDSLRDAYNEAKEEFDAQRPMLSEDALRARQSELDAIKRKYDSFAQDVWGEGGKAEQKHKELFAPVLERVNEVIDEIAAEQGVTLVLDVSSGGILYADVGMDITADVISELNREYAITSPDLARKIAVFSIAALDQESQTEGLGQRVRSAVKATVGSFKQDLNLEMIADADIMQMLEMYGYSFDQSIPESKAIEMGRNLDAGFVYIGTVEKEAGDIKVTIKLLMPSSREVVPPVEGSIAENEISLLSQKVSDLVLELQSFLIAEEQE